MALPLIATALIGGCQSGGGPTNNIAAAAPPKAAPSPADIARRLVAERLGSGLVFADAQTFPSKGATIVCGRVSQAGQQPQRYIAVGEQDVFVESQMQPGHMDQAAAEFCRNG
jgi:hypothetical protein